MNAMLLAAGRGERLLPLTLSQPKPALPVLGRPIATQILHWLARHGVERTVINLHHLPEVVRRRLGVGNADGLPELRYVHEPVILGTGGGIRNASGELRGRGPIIVTNADYLSDIDLTAAMEAHLRSGCLATLVLAPEQSGYSIVEVGERGLVLSLAGEPRVDPARVRSRHLFTGCQILEEELLDRIPAGRPSDIVRDLHRSLAAEGRLGSFMHRGFWWEFGSPERYLEGSLRLLAGDDTGRRVLHAGQDPVREFPEGVAAIGPGAELHDRARVVGRVALGYACYVSTGALLEDTIVMPESWIGPRCRLRRSVIAEGVELPADFEADALLVCNDPDPQLPLPPSVERRAGLLVQSFAAG
jgi:NDP-sugar pyrophosphorylase family protein